MCVATFIEQSNFKKTEETERQIDRREANSCFKLLPNPKAALTLDGICSMCPPIFDALTARR